MVILILILHPPPPTPTNRGKETNNFCEAWNRVKKHHIMDSTKAYNVLHLIHIVVKDCMEYFASRIITIFQSLTELPQVALHHTRKSMRSYTKSLKDVVAELEAMEAAGADDEVQPTDMTAKEASEAAVLSQAKNYQTYPLAEVVYVPRGQAYFCRYESKDKVGTGFEYLVGQKHTWNSRLCRCTCRFGKRGQVCRHAHAVVHNHKSVSHCMLPPGLCPKQRALYTLVANGGTLSEQDENMMRFRIMGDSTQTMTQYLTKERALILKGFGHIVAGGSGGSREKSNSMSSDLQGATYTHAHDDDDADFSMFGNDDDPYWHQLLTLTVPPRPPAPPSLLSHSSPPQVTRPLELSASAQKAKDARPSGERIGHLFAEKIEGMFAAAEGDSRATKRISKAAKELQNVLVTGEGENLSEAAGTQVLMALTSALQQSELLQGRKGNQQLMKAPPTAQGKKRKSSSSCKKPTSNKKARKTTTNQIAKSKRKIKMNKKQQTVLNMSAKAKRQKASEVVLKRMIKKAMEIQQ
jgi:hypothetical protein